MPRFLLIAAVTASLTACATASSNAPCPAVVEYDKATQARAAAALGALPDGSPLVTFMGDYAALRASARACAGR